MPKAALIALAFAAGTLSSSVALAQTPVAADTQSLLAAAIAGPQRSAEERARDVYRRPAETLAFFGLRPDMTVIEVSPGGG